MFRASNDVFGLDGFCPVPAIVFVCMDPGLPTLLVLLVFLHTSQHAGQQQGANMELGKIGHAGVAGQGREPQSLSTKFWDVPRVEEP